MRPDIKPDLLLILLVFFALRSNSTDAIVASFAIGFAADLSNSAVPADGARGSSASACSARCCPTSTAPSRRDG